MKPLRNREKIPSGTLPLQSSVSSMPSTPPIWHGKRPSGNGSGSTRSQIEQEHRNSDDEDDVETLTNSEEDLRIPRRKRGSNEKEELVPLMR